MTTSIPTIAMVGLGRMGANIVRRLQRNGITTVAYDINPESAEAHKSEGAIPAATLADISTLMPAPRTVWIMVPASVTNQTIEAVAQHLEAGDTIIDGGNSYYKNDLANAAKLAERGINFVDVGTSGGVYGLERGYSLMIGGDKKVVASLTPIFEALAPGFESADRTPGRTGDLETCEKGFQWCGPVGAGHYVKMIHNGIEYGMMAAFAEGLAIFESAKDSEAGYDIDIPAVTEVWRRGSVVASWLLDLTAQALVESKDLGEYATAVSDSGEGRWTVEAAIENGIPAHVLSAALYSRFASRDNDDYSNRVLNAMRYKFGGHNENPKASS